jgi:nucleotide-binding universal stress UspA family protein
MFRHLLAPIDGSPDASVALNHAIEIAQEEAGTIHALFVADRKVIETAPNITNYATGVDTILNPALTDAALRARHRLAKHGQQTLSQAKKRSTAANIRCETEYVEGVVANVILNRAVDADLVILGRRGEGANWAGPQLGSVLESIVRYSPTPVLAVQAEIRPLTRIVVAFDGSERAIDGLRIGTFLARHKDRELIVLTVEDGQSERHKAWAMGQKLVAAQGQSAIHVSVQGHAVREIVRFAAEEACDLIVLGSYGHSRFVETRFGSTADEVLHQAICPVLLCR